MTAGKLTLLTLLTTALLVVHSNLSQTDRIALTGKVSLLGTPLKEGLVLLYPEKGTESQIISAPIEGGRFRFQRDDGPAPGEYRLEIYKFVPKKRIDASHPTELNQVSQIKLSVPSESKLHADIEL